jgi:hypothetical protein
VLADNGVMGRWAAWTVWRRSVDLEHNCNMNCNMSSFFSFFFPMHARDRNMTDLVMTSESIMMLGNYGANMICVSVDDPVHEADHPATRHQPQVQRSSQFCGSPNDIEKLF